MSRLDRLVSLLDNGVSTYIRNVAAEQIADVQKSRPDELFNLLGRVAPFLQSPKWDTRISAAKTIGLIAENCFFHPDSLNSDADLEEAVEIKREEGETGVQGELTALNFDSLDIGTVIQKGTPLLGSAGREYDQAVQQMDNEHRMRMQRVTLRQKIGMEFLGDEETKALFEDSGDSSVKSEVKPEIKSEIKSEIKEEPTEVPPEDPPAPVNARLRALAKRKARFGAPAPKRTTKSSSPAPEPASPSGNGGSTPNGGAGAKNSDKADGKRSSHGTPGAASPNPSQTGDDKMVVEHKDKTNEYAETVLVKDPREFPFEALCNRLKYDMFEPTWETRHGALLCLREIIRVHGSNAGKIKGESLENNRKRNEVWLEDMACRLCCIFALDRFADYVSDQAVAPVRESCAQTLGALITYLNDNLCKTLFTVFNTLINGTKESQVSWACCHGGMLGLRYFVTLKTELVVNSEKLFSDLIACVFKGLTGNDDEVQAISAAVLLPIADNFVEKRPKEEITKLLNIMWEYISDLKDELSTSVGNVMDLLGTLCTFPKVLEVVLSDSGSSLEVLVPKLYQFLRHSIIDVRKAVLRTLKTFLTLEHDAKSWVSIVTLRLLFQNILLEQNDQVLDMSMDLWKVLMEFVKTKSLEERRSLFSRFWESAFPLLLTPVGTARRFYGMNDQLLVRPSGKSYAEQLPASASADSKLEVNIDGPMILGDTLIVPVPIFIRAKVFGSIALGHCAAIATEGGAEILPFMRTDVIDMFSTPMSSQQLVLAMLLEEFGKSLPINFAPLTPFAAELEPLLVHNMDTSRPATLWRDINPILRAVRTQCQSLFSLLKSQDELHSADVVLNFPTIIEGDHQPNGKKDDVFTLALAERLATDTFESLKSKLSPETQVRMADTLEDGRRNLESSIEEAKTSLESRNVCIRSANASAYIALNRGKLPSKLNPIIRGLMDEIKSETIGLLHERTSVVLANLVSDLIASGRANVGSKIVKNLCGFLCVDIHEAPEFDGSTEDVILSLKKDDINLENKSIAEQLRKERENHVAFIKRQGAILTLSKLCTKYGDELFNTMPEIRSQMFSTLTSSEDVANKEDCGQKLIDNLAIIRALVPYLDVNLLQPEMEKALPFICNALYSRFPVVRHVAAKCMAVICNAVPTLGITYVVKHILSGSLIDQSSVVKRQGAIEAIFHMMLTMGDNILPYIVFFIVPVLGRMSDSNNQIRLISATTFASIIKLVPLEAGVQNPPDIPAELLEGKEREREFIGQMMDPSRIEEFEIPVAVNATLRRYQQEGVNWLAFLNKYHLHGILCDDMGLGKTLQTICMIASDHVLRKQKFEETKNAEYRTLPSLIICPTTLTGHWVEEFNKYVPSLNVAALVGSPRARQVVLSNGSLKKADIVVTSYETARNEVSRLSESYDWNYCVLDEGHIIKNANSKLSKSVKQYRAYHRLVLTGTPIQNNVLELWSLFDFLMPGFLGNEKSFNERFSKPISARSSGKASPKEQEAATLALEALHKQVLPFTLRRLKEDVLDDLPPKIIQDYYCDLNDVQRKLYTKFTNQQRAQLQNDDEKALETGTSEVSQVKNHIFPALQYLRKLCNHPAFVQHTKEQLEKKWPLDFSESPKLIALQQLLHDCGIGVTLTAAAGVPEAISQHRALIFCQQREMVDLVEKSLLQAHMPSVSYLRMDGSTPGHARQSMVSKFNDDPSIDVLLLTTHVGGLGLNLTGADTVIFVEHDWNPMNDLQAMDRAHRLGQKRTVNVYRLITRNTLEERIMGLQQFKLNIASTVINQQNKGLLSMDTDQILDLFSSSAENDGAGSAKSDSQEKQVDPETGKLVDKKADFASSLGELWDENEYAEEYNVDNFIKSLKK